MLIAQLSDIHIGGARHHGALLRDAIAEINKAGPDVVVIAGDITDEGYPDQYGDAREQLESLACPNVVAVPGNHDSPSCRLPPVRADVRRSRLDPAPARR
jgi:3',5'-cyclic-AMP phosphodiesterase